MRLLLVLLSLSLLVAAPAPGQTGDAPPRPRLDRDADPNDWTAYYDRGVEIFRRQPEQAARAFWWAARLAPDRAEPLYGRWAAFWMGDFGRWERYLRGDQRVMDSPETLRADSLLLHAYQRNPFVHRGLLIVLIDELPGRWRRDRVTQGWLAYAQGDAERALRYFESAAQGDPSRRHEVALTLVSAGAVDRAAVEMDALIA